MTGRFVCVCACVLWSDCVNHLLWQICLFCNLFGIGGIDDGGGFPLDLFARCNYRSRTHFLYNDCLKTHPTTTATQTGAERKTCRRSASMEVQTYQPSISRVIARIEFQDHTINSSIHETNKTWAMCGHTNTHKQRQIGACSTYGVHTYTNSTAPKRRQIDQPVINRNN